MREDLQHSNIHVQQEELITVQSVAYRYFVKSFMYPQTTTPPHTMGTHQLSMSQTVAKLGSNCNMTTKCFRSNQQQFEEERRKREAIRGVKESSDVFVFTGEWRTWMALHCLAKQLTKMSRMFRRTNSDTARRRRPVGRSIKSMLGRQSFNDFFNKPRIHGKFELNILPFLHHNQLLSILRENNWFYLMSRNSPKIRQVNKLFQVIRRE